MTGSCLLTIQEYVSSGGALSEAAARSGSSVESLRNLLLSAGERTATKLGFLSNPLKVTGTEIKAVDFAGMIRAGDLLELEVVPKFLDASASAWREDFFFLSMISRHGHILHRDKLGALTAASSDLTTLIAQCLAVMFLQHSRRPIRTYRKHVETDFLLEGEVDEIDLLTPDSGGFRQNVVRYSRDNPYNRLLLEAAKSVLPSIRENVTRTSIERMISMLGKQESRVPQRYQRLPSRARHWQSTTELARDILDGLGTNYGAGRTLAPGFVIDTWRLWEDVLEIGSRALPSGFRVHSQKGCSLGKRQQRVGATWGSPHPFDAVPDFLVEGTEMPASMIVDAKYKGRFSDTARRVSEADVYEALAFSEAHGIPRVLLLYPRSGSLARSRVGSQELFEKITIGNTQIWAADTEIRGIASGGSLGEFAQNLGKGLVSTCSEMLTHNSRCLTTS